MEVLVKKAIKSGNSSAVILPRSWLNKEIRVEIAKKTPEMMLSENIEILRKYIDLKSVIGIYLAGSYARKEESADSDIDILIITENTDREIIKEGIYNILLVSKALLKQKLERDLLPLGQMLKEARPLLNSGFLSPIKINVTKRNVKWYIDTTESKLDILEKAINIYKNKKEEGISDFIAYTIILRIRTLYIIESLIKCRNYMNKDFIRMVKKTAGGTITYERYLSIKNDTEDENIASLSEAEALCSYLKNQLSMVKNLLS